MDSAVHAPLSPDAHPADPEEALDQLLRQVITGFFVLTDGQGAVSKWSEPAELLFGKEAPDALGHSFFDNLLSGPLSEDAEQWRRFLAAGDPPHARALVEVTARHDASGEDFPLEAVFERDGRSVVYLAGRRPREREVVLGPSNADFVVIEKGLARGDRVLLQDPGRGAPDTSVAPGS